MLRAVFDTNVLASVLIKRGRPRELWNKVLESRIRLIISNELLTEFDIVMVRPQFRKYLRRAHLLKFRRVILQKAAVIRIKKHFQQLTEDPDDNMVMETAHAGKADYIVSGDKHLLSLKKFRGIEILSIDQMLQVLRES